MFCYTCWMCDSNQLFVRDSPWAQCVKAYLLGLLVCSLVNGLNVRYRLLWREVVYKYVCLAPPHSLFPTPSPLQCPCLLFAPCCLINRLCPLSTKRCKAERGCLNTLCFPGRTLPHYTINAIYYDHMQNLLHPFLLSAQRRLFLSSQAAFIL